jgi:hypothetical protein
MGRLLKPGSKIHWIEPLHAEIKGRREGGRDNEAVRWEVDPPATGVSGAQTDGDAMGTAQSVRRWRRRPSPPLSFPPDGSQLRDPLFYFLRARGALHYAGSIKLVQRACGAWFAQPRGLEHKPNFWCGPSVCTERERERESERKEHRRPIVALKKTQLMFLFPHPTGTRFGCSIF